MAFPKAANRFIIAAAVLLLFIVVFLVLNRVLTLESTQRWVLGIGLILLGLIAAGAILWFLRPREVVEVDTGDDVLLAIASARARLPHNSFGNRALVLMLGPTGSAKTSLVARSGGDPELLAGVSPASAMEAPVPTKTVNVWAMQQAVVAELGGGLLTNAPRWASAVRALRAPRVAAALGKGEAAPRAAVVCVPCDLFYAGANGQQLEELGHLLRQRLAETSRELGLAMPVYVVFTRMDKLPHFEQWIGVFTKEELRAPFGATLPFDSASNTGNYAERLAPRIDAAFREFIDVTAARRIDLLGRDHLLERRYGAYELPRELRKLVPAVTSFLVELCRPTQLGSSPQLRGFYFVGARPVVVSDVAKAPAVKAASAPAITNATQIFREGGPPPAAVQAAAPAVSRRVPEWVFLDRFLRDVVLADNGAASVARGGVQMQRTRRFMLGAAIAASLVMMVAVTTSWLYNRALTARVHDAARDVAVIPVAQAAAGSLTYPPLETVRSLEFLRAKLDTVRTYRRDGAPWYMRLWLWHGDALFNAARPVWYEGFRAHLFAVASKTLEDSLNALPDVPTDKNDYQTSYNWLKAYLITTSFNDSSKKEFLTPVLFETGRRGISLAEDVAALSTAQFDFYSTELPDYNPWPRDPDMKRVVPHSRDFLNRFTGGEQIYRNMVAATNKEVDSLPLKPTPGILVVQPYVLGAYTTKGAVVMARKLAAADTATGGEPWVVGPQTKAAVDKSVLRGLYAADYARTWRGVVENAKVVRPTSVKDAADKLERIGSNTSPLIALLQTVSVNTEIDSATSAAFQPVHVVSPPKDTLRITSEKNQPYLEGLVQLQGALAQISKMPTNDTVAINSYNKAAFDAGADVRKAHEATAKLASNFDTRTTGAMARAVQELLRTPIRGAEEVLLIKPKGPRPPIATGGGGGTPPPPPADPRAPINARGAALCAELTPLLNRFPFNAEAKLEARIDDVTDLLAPGKGKFWLFHQEMLAAYLTKVNGVWTPKTANNISLSPTFVEFFKQAALRSDALFRDGEPIPHVRWDVFASVNADMPLVIFTHNGLNANFNSTSVRNVFDWPAEKSNTATLQAQFKKDKPVTVASETGEWAIFRLVKNAPKYEIAGRKDKVTWTPTGKNAVPVLVEFESPYLPSTVHVLQPGWLGAFSCVGQVTQ